MDYICILCSFIQFYLVCFDSFFFKFRQKLESLLKTRENDIHLNKEKSDILHSQIHSRSVLLKYFNT